jgi:hypothetical protein
MKVSDHAAGSTKILKPSSLTWHPEEVHQFLRTGANFTKFFVEEKVRATFRFFYPAGSKWRPDKRCVVRRKVLWFAALYRARHPPFSNSILPHY